MTMIKIREPGRQINEADIASLEGEFGAKLPESYRRFLLLNNGGIPSPDVVDVKELPGSPTDIQVFFGIDRRVESSDLSWNLQLIQGRSPRNVVLPIACDSGGNLFCLRVSKDGEVEVLYCDMSKTATAFYKVAPSFDSFLKQIRTWGH